MGFVYFWRPKNWIIFLMKSGFKIKEKVVFFVVFDFLFPGLFADIALAVVEDMEGIEGSFHGLGAFLDPLSAAI